MIIISRVGERVLKYIEELNDKDTKDFILVLKTSNLEKKSKLRTFFEKSKRLIAIPFYEDDARTLTNIISGTSILYEYHEYTDKPTFDQIEHFISRITFSLFFPSGYQIWLFLTSKSDSTQNFTPRTGSVGLKSGFQVKNYVNLLFTVFLFLTCSWG